MVRSALPELGRLLGVGGTYHIFSRLKLVFGTLQVVFHCGEFSICLLGFGQASAST
jgi:hypothetical protein